MKDLNGQIERKENNTWWRHNLQFYVYHSILISHLVIISRTFSNFNERNFTCPSTNNGNYEL